MTKITILDKTYQISWDSFGTLLIEGMILDDFMETISPDQRSYLARYGVKVMREEPEHFKDIVERQEIHQLDDFVDPRL